MHIMIGMRVRTLRLTKAGCRPQMLPPGLGRRSFASETVKPRLTSTEHTFSTVKAYAALIPNVPPPIRSLPRLFPKKEWKKFLAKEENPSKLHQQLSDIYQDGGVIPQEVLPKIRGEREMPRWSDWGVPLKIRTPKGSDIIVLPNIWLRDNCRCTQCVNADTMQKAFDTFSIPENIAPSEVRTKTAGLYIKWGNDSHESIYPWDSILLEGTPAREMKDPKEYWGAEIAADPPSVSYDEVMADDAGVGVWTEKIRRYGFCYVDGCPVDPEKTKELLARISFIRVTHYGGFYDFTSDLTMRDTAYTTLALGAHTDTAYFTDPAGLQMFHLLSHTSGEGGASLLVDGFHAASLLKKESPASYACLAKTPIRWHASGNEGITITPAKGVPVFNFGPGELKPNRPRRLQQVRWNNDDRCPIVMHGMETVMWYHAARKWNDILKRKEMEYWAQLKPGRPLIFDNWRVLHGRSAFTGKRRICGGYINHDDYISRWRNTNFSREEVMDQILMR